MQSIMGATGFACQTISETSLLVGDSCRGAEQYLHAGNGGYGVTTARRGAQLWSVWTPPGGLDSERPNAQVVNREVNRAQGIPRDWKLTGVMPYHVTECRVPMVIEASLPRSSDDSRYDGGLRAVHHPKEPYSVPAQVESTRIHFDLTGFWHHSRRQLPFVAEVGLIGLAYGVKPAEDIARGATRPAADYIARLSAVPRPVDFEPALRNSVRSLRGIVVSRHVLRNNLSGNQYERLRLGCVFGDIDIFAATGSIHGEVGPGTAVETFCWMVGQLHGEGLEPPVEPVQPLHVHPAAAAQRR